MNMKQHAVHTVLLLSVCVAVFIACNHPEHKSPSATVSSTVPTNLNAIETILPDAPGYASFKMNCMSCHSAMYIQMQPDLPEKTWAAIVTKMQKNFGAPVADSSVKEIVQYLVAIKGKK
jgi:sulfite dehydrogenase